VPALAAGTRLSDDLVLTRPIGEGHANVWVAKHSKLGSDVVVKLLPDSLVTSPEARVRFSREVRAGSKIESDHVVKRLDSGVTDDGVPFVALELLVGEDLRTHLGKVGPLPPAQVVEIVKQVAIALIAVHGAGIVHRDIKPENVFLCAREGAAPLVKVLDFGVAKNVKNKSSVATSAGIVVGTPTYMSPEQMAGGVTDGQVDLWALTVVAWEALTGCRPFPGEDLQTIGRVVLVGPRPKISGVEPEFAALDSFFERAFAKERSARFTDAAELSEAFARAVASLSDPQVPSAAATRTRSLETFVLKVKPQRRAPWLLLAMALALAAIVVGVAVFLRR
jgi:serine/threonine-protein kinase